MNKSRQIYAPWLKLTMSKILMASTGYLQTVEQTTWVFDGIGFCESSED